MICNNFNDKEIDALREFLEDCEDYEVLLVINTCRGLKGSLEDLNWMEMYMFDELYQENTPLQIAIDVSDAGNDFDPTDNYFRFDCCGNLESAVNIELSDYEITDIIDALDNLNYSDLPDCIKEVLREVEDNDDDAWEDDDSDDDCDGYYDEDF